MCVVCAHGLLRVSYLKNLEFRNWKWLVSQLRQITPFSRQITPFSRQITPFTRQITPLKNVEVWQKWNLVMPYLIIPIIRWSRVMWSGTYHAINKIVIRRRRSTWWYTYNDNRVVPGKTYHTKRVSYNIVFFIWRILCATASCSSPWAQLYPATRVLWLVNSSALPLKHLRALTGNWRQTY